MANANQFSDFERNADLIASADTQSAAGVNILDQLVTNTNTSHRSSSRAC
jgi:hypothetical protein